jgi:ethanolamine utilization cobalamin adenosyltransferase
VSAREQTYEDSTSPSKKTKKKKKDITSLQKMKIIVKSTKTISFDGQIESSSDSENPSQKKQSAPI